MHHTFAIKVTILSDNNNNNFTLINKKTKYDKWVINHQIYTLICNLHVLIFAYKNTITTNKVEFDSETNENNKNSFDFSEKNKMCIVYCGRCLFQFFVSKIHVELMQVEYFVRIHHTKWIYQLAALHVKLVEWQLKQQAALDNFHFRFVKQVVCPTTEILMNRKLSERKIFPSKFWSWYFFSFGFCLPSDWVKSIQ